MRIPVFIVIVSCATASAFAQTPPGVTPPRPIGRVVTPEQLEARKACEAALDKNDSEKNTSARKLREMKEPRPLKEQYEEDMYFAKKRMKLLESSCLSDAARAAVDTDARYAAAKGLFEKTRGVCAIVAKACKATKRW